MILVDTNVIARLCRNNDPLYIDAERALRSLRINGSSPVIVPQNLYEFWVIATRPANVNGFAMSAERALLWMSYFKRVCKFIPEPANTYNAWEDLLRAHKTLGKPAHDARLVAAMQELGIVQILTFNTSDFSRYAVTPVDPRNVL